MLAQLLDDSTLREYLHKRYQEIVELHKGDPLDLPLSEKIYLQGVMDGIHIMLKRLNKDI